MQIMVELPDDLTKHPEPGRCALEALALDGYRSGALSQYEARLVLKMSRLAFEAFLKERNVTEHIYDPADLEDDVAMLRQMSGRHKQP